MHPGQWAKISWCGKLTLTKVPDLAKVNTDRLNEQHVAQHSNSYAASEAREVVLLEMDQYLDEN